jgi:hypothetical protein
MEKLDEALVAVALPLLMMLAIIDLSRTPQLLTGTAKSITEFTSLFLTSTLFSRKCAALPKGYGHTSFLTPTAHTAQLTTHNSQQQQQQVTMSRFWAAGGSSSESDSSDDDSYSSSDSSVGGARATENKWADLSDDSGMGGVHV